MLIVVGGHSRNIGKTSVVAGIIRALPEWHWTALKITQYGHGVCSTEGERCECAADYDHPYALTQEPEENASDSGRFLEAGAHRSYWLRTAAGQLGYALPAFRRISAEAENLIVESNSILQFLKPDLYLVVLDFSVADFKPSSLLYLDRADALIVTGGPSENPDWRGVAPSLWISKKKFFVDPPRYVTPEVAQFICARREAGDAPRARVDATAEC